MANKAAGGSHLEESDASHVHFAPGALTFTHNAEHSKFIQTARSKSRWLEWSERQRHENIKKKEEIQKQRDVESKTNVNWDVIIKARKESLGFLHGEHIEKLLAEDSQSPLARATAAAVKASQEPQKKNRKDGKKKKGKVHFGINQALDITDGYTDDQLKALYSFWDHWVFHTLRPVGVLLAILSLLLAVPPVFSTRWLIVYYYSDQDTASEAIANHSTSVPTALTTVSQVTHATQEHHVVHHFVTRDHHKHANKEHRVARLLERVEIHGLWFNCSGNLASFTGILDDSCQPVDVIREKGWQSTIIGTLMFALAFGIIAVALTISGLRSFTLSRRVYYYHSAGEIYFVCALCSSMALVAFPAVMELSLTLPQHEYGIGYYLAWGSPLCFFVSAFCMSFDDMIHSYSNKGCCKCASDKHRKGRAQQSGVKSDNNNMAAA